MMVAYELSLQQLDRKHHAEIIREKEKAKLTREQNRASRHIYRQKHDAQKQPGAK